MSIQAARQALQAFKQTIDQGFGKAIVEAVKVLFKGYTVSPSNERVRYTPQAEEGSQTSLESLKDRKVSISSEAKEAGEKFAKHLRQLADESDVSHFKDANVLMALENHMKKQVSYESTDLRHIELGHIMASLNENPGNLTSLQQQQLVNFTQNHHSTQLTQHLLNKVYLQHKDNLNDFSELLRELCTDDAKLQDFIGTNLGGYFADAQVILNAELLSLIKEKLAEAIKVHGGISMIDPLSQSQFRQLFQHLQNSNQ